MEAPDTAVIMIHDVIHSLLGDGLPAWDSDSLCPKSNLQLDPHDEEYQYGKPGKRAHTKIWSWTGHSRCGLQVEHEHTFSSVQATHASCSSQTLTLTGGNCLYCGHAPLQKHFWGLWHHV